MHTLVLNATCEIMRIVNWKRAVTLYCLDKVDILEEYDKKILTPSVDMNVPAVIKYKHMIKPKYKLLKFNRLNVYARDNYTCQYCYRKLLKPKLTMDHVIPKSRGGPSSWLNCVTCCKECNLKKANRTPKEANMKLYKEPRQPNQTESFVLAMKMGTDVIPELWKNYVSPTLKLINSHDGG